MQLLQNAREVRFSDGDWLYGTTEAAGGLFGIVEGGVRLYATFTRGEAHLLDILGPGAWFGQVGLLRNGQRLVTAIAAQSLSAILVPRSTLMQLLHETPQFVDSVLRLDLEHFQYVLRAYSEVVSLAPRARIAGRLHALSGRMPSGAIAKIVATQADLAEMVGVERKTVHRILKDFENLGLIHLTYRAIEICSRRGLAQIRDEV
ncbi:MAG: Crp/Fnr family transcriptional regulator [Alphaproteobacteria bacterium]|nr:Crp/Fnr family transcriptional regulator [Alphaproteobacteria bacterium]